MPKGTMRPVCISTRTWGRERERAINKTLYVLLLSSSFQAIIFMWFPLADSRVSTLPVSYRMAIVLCYLTTVYG